MTLTDVAKSHHEGKNSETVSDEILDCKLSEEDKNPLSSLQKTQNFSITGTGNYVLDPEYAPNEVGGPFRLCRLTSVPNHDRPPFNRAGSRKF